MAFWVLAGAVLLLALWASVGRKADRSGSRTERSHWIYHPHEITPDDYECSRCHARFRKETAACPRCGAEMKGRTVTDEGEWMDEDETLDILLDDD